MAGSAIIGALRAVLGIDTAAWDDGLKDSQSSLSSWSAGVMKGVAGVAAAVAAAATAMGYSIVSNLQKIDNLGKAAEKVGIPIEQFSGLASAAAKSDVNIDQLSTSVLKLSKNMAAIAGGDKSSDAARAFSAIGVSAVDANGKIKSAQDVILQLADKFSGFNDGANKSALALAIFGKSGADMIPFLNKGSAALQDLISQNQVFIDQKTADAADRFNKSVASLTNTFNGFMTKIAAQLAPMLSSLAEQFQSSAKEAKSFDGVSAALTATVQVLATGIVAASEVFGYFADRIGIAVSALWSAATGDLAGAWQKLTTPVTSLSDRFERLKTGVMGIWSEPSKGADLYAQALQSVDQALEAVGKVKIDAPNILKSDDMEKFFQAQQKRIAGINAEAAAVGASTYQQAALKAMMEAQAVAEEKGIPITDALTQKITALGASAGDAALKLQGQQLAFQNLDPLTQYQIQLANTQAAMVAVGASADQLARGQQAVAQQFGMTWGQIGANIAGVGGALSQLTGTFAQQNKAMGIASKAFGIGQAIINTQIAVTKALATLPPPASYAAVALAVAQGAASIATISAQKFKTGGAFNVPGGIGGGDKVFAPMMLEPGERVDVTPNGQRGTSSGPTEITLRGNAKDFFSGDNLRAMFEAINAGHRDGYRIQFAPA